MTTADPDAQAKARHTAGQREARKVFSALRDEGLTPANAAEAARQALMGGPLRADPG